MEEKKLNDTEINVGMTDEEIIESLADRKFFSKAVSRKKQKAVLKGTLDLIHRLQGENAEQKAEIELLTEELQEADESIKYSDELLGKRREEISKLKKQVNEQDKEIDRLEKVVHEQAEQYYDCEQRTAKEILTELDLFFKGTTFRKGYEFKKIEEKLKEIAKSKGVEVE